MNQAIENIPPPLLQKNQTEIPTPSDGIGITNQFQPVTQIGESD